MTESEAIEKLIATAEAEDGYLEKKDGTSSYLYDKTANAGSANYTKYGKEMHDLLPSVMDYPAAWCDAFVDWCFYKTFGASYAKQMLCGTFDDYTVNSAGYYKNAGRWYTASPKRGDQIFFKNSSGTICHTGIVTKVSGTTIYTIEGNTSSASGVIANGGAVRANKTYSTSYSLIAGYGRPKWSVVATDTASSDTTAAASSSTLSKTTQFTGTVTASSLNIRTGAGTSYGTCSFSPLSKGTAVSVCDTTTATDGSTWYYICYNGKYGFASAAYISTATSTDTATSTTTIDTTASTATTDTTASTATTDTTVDAAKSYNKTCAGTYKVTKAAYLRSGAAKTKASLATLSVGDKVTCYGYYTVNSAGNTWYYVTCNGLTGFVVSTKVEKV